MIKNDAVIVLLILLLGGGAGFTYLFSGYVFPMTGDSDSAGYNTLALNLLNGFGYSLDTANPTARDAPVYPLFLAGVYKIFGYGNLTAVRILQILATCAFGILVYFIGKKYLGLPEKFSFLAAAIVVLWPYFILYSTLILTETLYTFLLIVAVVSLLEYHRSFSHKSALVCGVSLALASLMRPVAFFLPLWLALFCLLFWRKKKILKKQLLIILVFTLALSPWTVRNFIQFQQFIPATDWLFPMITAVFVKDAGDTYYQPLTENPAESIKSRLKNIILFWNPGAEGMRAQKFLEMNPKIAYLFLAYKIIFFLLLFLALFSIFYVRKKEVFLLWSLILYFWLVHAAILPYPRYTLPIMPLIILLALFSQVKLWTSWKARSAKSLAKS